MKNKKIFTLTIAFIVSLSIVACGKEEVSSIEEYSAVEESSSIEDSSSETLSEETETFLEEENIEEIDVTEAFFNNLGKPISEVQLVDEDNKKFTTMQTDENTYWLFSQCAYEVSVDLGDISCYGSFFNPTNGWISDKDVTLSYYTLTTNTMDFLFPGLVPEDAYNINELDTLVNYFGEPVYELIREDTIQKGYDDYYVFEYNDYYVVAIDDSYVEGYVSFGKFYLLLKEDISYISTSMAEELGQPAKREKSSFVGNGAINDSIKLEVENGNLTFRMCDRIINFTSLPNYKVKCRSYSLDSDGVLNVSGISFEYLDDFSLSFSFPSYNTFTDYVYPFYSTLISNEKVFTLLEENDKYDIYKADPNATFSGETSDYCIHMKELGLYITAYGLDVEDSESECLNACKYIGDYFSDNVTVEIK